MSSLKQKLIKIGAKGHGRASPSRWPRSPFPASVPGDFASRWREETDSSHSGMTLRDRIGAAGHNPGGDFLAAPEIAIVRIKFGFHPGNPGLTRSMSCPDARRLLTKNVGRIFVL